VQVDSIFDYSNRKVLVTGAGRGIGRGVAEVFAEAGADVAINARTAQYVHEAARKVASTTGRTVIPLVHDLTRAEKAAEMVQEVVEHLGAIDILVNCVGDAIKAPLGSATDEHIRLTLDLNVLATILCCRSVGPLLIAQSRGKVINVSSSIVARSASDLSVYAASKAGIVGLTQALALEWAPHNIQVNAIAPGIFSDALSHPPEVRARIEAIGQTLPAQRLGDTREVGYLALYLASAAADYVTGQTVIIDGGMTL
jgi:NAD(P)-dependent dehydrogenase (short-subunit alcohol dehydrogenase family)